jgi:hypothetical protein
VQLVHEIVAHAAHAAALTDLIERVGSYAGFAAIVGLAVLAALYFSQARDVRRLREWAGRAPERAAELQHAGRTAQAAAVRTGQPGAGTVGPAQPVARPAGAAQAGARPAPAGATAGTQAHGTPARPATVPGTRPGAVPATAGANAAPATAAAGAAASAAGAAPATAGGAPATAKPGAATGQTAAPARPGAAPGQAAPARPGTQPGQTARPATAATGQTAAPARPGQPSAPARPGAPGGGAPGATPGQRPAARPAAAPGARPATTAPVRGNTGTGAKVLPARPVQPQRPRPMPTVAGRSGQTAVIPPPRKARRWTAPRYLALIVAGVIVLGLGGTVGFLALTGDDDSKPKSSATVPLPTGEQQAGDKNRSKPAAPAIDPATVTVAVLNGTQVTGLAGTTGQKVSAAGFKLGNVATGAQDAPRAESVVLYKPGASRQARAVSRKLGISQIEPVDPASATLAGTATVVVVVGADRATQ